MCIDKDYYSADINSIKGDLNKKCNENSAHKILEKAVGDLRMELNNKTQAIQALQKQIRDMERNILQSVNKTVQASAPINENLSRLSLVQNKLENAVADLEAKLINESRKTNEALRKKISVMQKGTNTKYESSSERIKAFNETVQALFMDKKQLQEEMSAHKQYVLQNLNIFEQTLLQFVNDKNESLSNHPQASNKTSQASTHLISIHKNVVWLVSLFCIALFFVVLILVVVYPPSRVFRH